MGGIRLGFEQAFKKAGYNTKCVLTSEIKEAAIKAHELNFPGEKIEGDVTKIETKDIDDIEVKIQDDEKQAMPQKQA